MKELSGRIAVVTGGSRGIGKAIALELAENGANVVINYSKDSKGAQEVAEYIRNKGIDCLTIKANVSLASEVENMVETIIEKYGRIDILVNNAGITRDSLLARMKEKDWDDVIDINLKGVYNCTKSVVKVMMKQRWGRVVNISSVVGITGNPGQTNYSAAKAGIIGFTKSCARELASRGITVNAVAPGFIRTDMTDKLRNEIKKELESKIPVGRLGKPEDVAHTVLFLVSSKADYITGQVINVDGGMVM
ncbi:3-oxoacyl-[acyl-carrier-protein] reductase FabG [Koleobacter methoxysyntrophicus]|uniref:3-oxoacyl-[acyl-carrier-protein] reductase n=1 Tax=Koleobacter methoxysyntrophicus TaxID=2751313 RepID=A0A8A0RQM8_9FIRM|nr:3-oxoacyl-[acyl-carrier-protein] reductase [Koleobacter methoxysyntrophicus]QSQ09848.1 3-oxoacyl-[acyl-carrier-protein] reductase FabG [Koleobacter methoxysyntrophicus]